MPRIRIIRKWLLVMLSFLALSLMSGRGEASIVGYTNYSSFLANLPGAANTLDFESQGDGDLIASGDTVGGITFTYDFGGVSLQVRDDYDTTSPDNFLGTDDAVDLQDGDEFSLAFSANNAIGMFFITADEMFDDDITLTSGGLIQGLVAGDIEDTLGDGGQVFFIGIIDDMNSFTSADVGYFPDGETNFLYIVDDIVLSAAPSGAVPEPSSLALFVGLGLTFGLAAAIRRKTNASR